MKDDYKKLSKEWGSKGRKMDSRAAKAALRKPTQEDLEGVWNGLCPASKHGLDFSKQPCDLCKKEKKLAVDIEKIMDEIRVRMANPPDKCERCDVVPALRTETHGLFWNGNDWVCDDCAEETQQ